MFTLIDRLQEATDCYYIDFLPKKNERFQLF